MRDIFMKKLLNPLAFSQRVFYYAMRHLMGTITSVATQDNVAALTFDDGPDPTFTPRLLDILERHQARATFFVVGETAQQYPELIRRMAQAGHVIGNHSWDHPAFSLIPRQERRAQIRACAKAITPYGAKIFRPPFGCQNTASRLSLFWLGYQVVTWNLVAEDWLDHDAEQIVNRLRDKIRPGTIVNFHDSLHDFIEEHYINREPTLQAVDILLEELGDRFRFVTIPELLQHGRPRRVNWFYQPEIALLNGLRKQDGQPSWRYPFPDRNALQSRASRRT
jgi:peptidoglycan-N-acetylglucosamine deacetylase